MSTPRIYYGLDGRSVSLNQYQVYAGGSGGAAADGTGAAAIGSTSFFVVPQDWVKQNAGVEVGYRVLPEYDTKVTVGYRVDNVDRSNAQIGRSWTNTGIARRDVGVRIAGQRQALVRLCRSQRLAQLYHTLA